MNTSTTTTNPTPHSHPRITSPISYSSWIREILYVPATPVSPSYLAVFTTNPQGQSTGAMLYSEIPPHLPGLLEAGLGGISVGKAYNRLLRGKGYPYQRIDKETAVELRELMAKARAKVLR